ncbi:hypothetical protein CONPUDRAFT_50811, partial [Coniophora puteana RWD-64-598 SS2]
FTNNCDYGTPLFLYQADSTPQGAANIQGELNGGIAWLSTGDCGSSGVNCGAVEFTLQNTGYSQADITLVGNHYYVYSLGFNFINGCSSGLFCDSANCSEAFHSPDIGPLEQCSVDNCGVSENLARISIRDS